MRTIRRTLDAEYTDLNEVLNIPTPMPTQMLLDGMPYVAHDMTDVQKTWRKYGWTPPSETAEFRMKVKGRA